MISEEERKSKETVRHCDTALNFLFHLLEQLHGALVCVGGDDVGTGFEEGPVRLANYIRVGVVKATSPKRIPVKRRKVL